jgi:hypothetical protein
VDGLAGLGLEDGLVVGEPVVLLAVVGDGRLMMKVFVV